MNYFRRERRQRQWLLWGCVGLFFLRVFGQLQALLLSPPWLPPMHQWYSGLIPYPVLLPLQIILLVLMGVLAMRQTRPLPYGFYGDSGWRRALRIVAICYFLGMVARLIAQLSHGAQTVIEAGAIPVAFHWVLALFLLVLARPPLLRQPKLAPQRQRGSDTATQTFP